ncbi:ribosomal large subunit pseudouridine synthase B [Clostridiales bacterium]|nr:ribosomal large subunit pseudouridine synthase B [Clostridiales bacterium]
MERLQKYIADCGIASRRKAEGLILEGRVSVNGNIVTELGTKIDPNKDKILFDGKLIKPEDNKVYIVLNKPENYVTTASDQFGRPTVMDLIKGVRERVVPVGRLDYDTSGLLLLTNDGDVVYKLTHPKSNIDKVYEAKLFGVPDSNTINLFRRGITIDGKKTSPAKIELIKVDGRFSWCNITIHEGRNRQVRKMCRAARHPVASLRRISEGEIYLGELKKGEWRYLTNKEIRYLKEL